MNNMDAYIPPQDYLKHDLQKPVLEQRLSYEEANQGKSRIEEILSKIAPEFIK